MIYLDYAANTPVNDEVLNKVMNWKKEIFYDYINLYFI